MIAILKSMSRSNAVENRFSINGRCFSCTDFLEALSFYGSLDQGKVQVSTGNFYISHSEKNSLAPDPEVLQEWARDFRYENNLLSVEEFSSWLHSLNQIMNNDSCD